MLGNYDVTVALYNKVAMQSLYNMVFNDIIITIAGRNINEIQQFHF